jgi:zinc transport system substrate-binding protein
MRVSGQFLFIFFLAISLLVPLSSVQKKPDLLILTSIYPLYDFCRTLSGDFFDVQLLLPAGVSPHHWQPRFSDMAKLEKAAALVHIGPALEPWVKDLVRTLKNRDLRLISFEDLCFLKEEEDQLDPHIWLDFQLDIEIIQRLVAALSELAPAATQELHSRANEYIEKLKDLDSLYRKTLSSCRKRTIIVDGHGAFHYLARRYDLKLISLHGLNPEAELRPSQIKQMLDLIRQEKVKAIFFEAGSNPRLAHLIKDDSGIKILPLYPGHSPLYNEKREDVGFLSLMKENLKNLKEGLGCD